MNKKDKYFKLFQLAYEHTGDIEEAKHMVAQMAHESADFNKDDEGAVYSYERAKAVPFNAVKKMTEEEYNEIAVKTKKYPQHKGNRKTFFNAVYGNRMGNAADEGYKYRGRGYIQLTGKDNWEKAGLDPEKYEGRDMTEEEAFEVSTKYWDDNFPLKQGEDDFIKKRTKEEVSRILNSGEGNEKRKQRLGKYDRMEKLIGKDIEFFANAIKQREKAKKLNKEDMLNNMYPKNNPTSEYYDQIQSRIKKTEVQ
jgi:putative chitinase